MRRSCERTHRIISAIILVTVLCSASVASELQNRIDDQWLGSDAHRIEFVAWVNEAQPFAGLSQSQVLSLLGPPTSIHDNQEFPYNGLTERFDNEAFFGPREDSHMPVVWEYQTLRKGTKESQEWAGEGSGYLLDLVIQFNVNGKVYGCGTVQFTTGGDYYEMLDKSAR